ncbi:hypothetical protein BVX99_03295 [bacterium F16]|nr:hypothetical protein BVX99_03295 [bacterium F16]
MLNSGKFVWRAEKAPGQLEPKGMMWSQRLQKAGYSTYMAGKWHVKSASAAKSFETTGTVRGGMPGQTKDGYNRPTGPDDKKWLPGIPRRLDTGRAANIGPKYWAMKP